MPADKQTGGLILTPTDTNASPQRSIIEAYLRDSGFIGDRLGASRPDAFLVGDGFLQLITFMGCSPHIELTPPAHGGSFCHVRLRGPYPSPRLLYGRNTLPPSCGQCRKRLPQWREHLADWARSPAAADVLCPHCGHRQRPLDLNWKRSAGAGRLFVQVEDVFPGEAVPVAGFMRGLAQAGGVEWAYFYVQDESDPG